MVAHSTTKNVKNLQFDKLFLILSCNDENIKQVLYVLGPIIVPERRKSLKNMFNCS